MLDTTKWLREAFWDVQLYADQTLQLNDKTLSLKVSLYLTGQANDFECEIEDREGDISPQIEIGREIDFFLWYADSDPVYMGKYTIDYVEEETPSKLRISGLSSDIIKRKLKTENTRGFENTTLHQIVRRLAQENSLTLKIEGEDQKIERKEQKEETDLMFLNSLAEEYGYNLRIEGDKLLFVQRDIEEREAPVYPVDSVLKKAVVREKAYKTYRKCIVRFYDPVFKELVEVTVVDEKVKSENVLKKTMRCESAEQARKIAKALLKKANAKRDEIELETMGMPQFRPPVVLKLENQSRRLNGYWMIEQADHEYTKSEGYVCKLRGYGVDRED